MYSSANGPQKELKNMTDLCGEEECDKALTEEDYKKLRVDIKKYVITRFKACNVYKEGEIMSNIIETFIKEVKGTDDDMVKMGANIGKKIIIEANKIVGSLSTINIYKDHAKEYGFQRLLEESSSVLSSDIRGIAGSIEDNNHKILKIHLKNLNMDCDRYLENMNMLGYGYKISDSISYIIEYTSALRKLCSAGEYIKKSSIDNFNDNDLEYIENCLDEAIVHLDRTKSLLGYIYNPNIKKTSAQLRNIRITAEKGAIVQTGNDQNISHINDNIS